MKRISPDQLTALKIGELGLDSSALDFSSTEAIAAALRRAAGIFCPCLARTLIRSVTQPLRVILKDVEHLEENVENALEAMVAHGDLMEHSESAHDLSERTVTLVYAAPPTFVMRKSGNALLLGVVPDQAPLLPDSMSARITYVSHVRWLSGGTSEVLRSELGELGFIELSVDDWSKSPSQIAPTDYLEQMNAALSGLPPSGEALGLSVLDTSLPVRYYRGRWVVPKNMNGRFVARRQRSFGPDLWCYVELRNGRSERVLDLPVKDPSWRGCDEAWRLQMAIDATAKTPQVFSVNEGPAGTRILRFFSPVPMWAQRRWDAIGEPVLAANCLFAYKIPQPELDEEIAFMKEGLWLSEETG